MQHRLGVVRHPEANVLHASVFEILLQVFPRLLLLPVPNAKAEHFPFAHGAKPHATMARIGIVQPTLW
jgi:hypothetical protein